MVSQFEAGVLDMALNPPLQDAGRLKSNPQYQVVTNPNTGRYYTAGWNVANPPLDNKVVRQALNSAMNRQRFVDTVLLGLSRPATLPWIPTSPVYDAAKANYFTFDLDKAKALLVQAGVGPFAMEYLISPNFPELSDVRPDLSGGPRHDWRDLIDQANGERRVLQRDQQSDVPRDVRDYQRARKPRAWDHHSFDAGVQPRPQQ